MELRNDAIPAIPQGQGCGTVESTAKRNKGKFPEMCRRAAEKPYAQGAGQMLTAPLATHKGDPAGIEKGSGFTLQTKKHKLGDQLP